MKNTKERLQAYAEVDYILKHMEDTYVEKVPEDVRRTFEEWKDTEYVVNIDIQKPLEEQNLKRTTLVILSLLNMKYWCETEEEKQEIIKEWEENEKVHSESLIGIDALEKVFNNNVSSKVEKEKETSLVKVEEVGIFKKILMKIQKMFKRR